MEQPTNLLFKSISCQQKNNNKRAVQRWQELTLTQRNQTDRMQCLQNYLTIANNQLFKYETVTVGTHELHIGRNLNSHTSMIGICL